MEKKTKLDLIKEGYEAARDNKPGKKYPIGDMVMPADKVAFIKEAIQKLKASNKSDYESGEFDVFNHKQEGRYGAFEEVLQWLNPFTATPQGAVGFADKSQFIREYKQYKENLTYLGGPDEWTFEKVSKLSKMEAYEAIMGFNNIIRFLDDVLYAYEEGAKDWEERCLKAEAANDEGQSQQPGSEGEFAEWLQKNRWYSFENGKWYYAFEQGTAMSDKAYQKKYVKTTAELYEVFKKEEKP